jgi:23S rRNA-/tRNA-specific pseudouridylate synthase
LISETYNIKRQMLHAKELQITLPGQDKPSKFVAKLPDDFQSALSKFSKID